MTIKGVVEDIVFRNNENGYTVLDLDCHGELITCVGCFSFISSGEEIEILGDYTENEKYGRQFTVKSYKTLDPQSTAGIMKYLGSGILKGVGEVTAERIVKAFGKDSLAIIEFNPGRLCEIKGISKEGAARIGESFAEIKKMKNTIIFLQRFDITINLAMKIYDIYKEKTEEILNKNPYKLVEDVDGIGFLTADKIAIKMGIPKNSPFRARAAILHTIKNNSEKNGSTFLPKSELLSNVFALLGGVYQNVFDDAILDLKIENSIKLFDFEIKENSIETGVALTSLYLTEQAIAAKLILLSKTDKKKSLSFDKEIENFEVLNNIAFHSDQKAAINLALNSGVAVITGGPGTGKTTIIKCIVSILNGARKKFLLMAPTGRASKRLSESTGFEASTIHRALGVNPQGDRISFVYNEYNKFVVDCIIVDEVSMVDAMLLNSLLKAIRHGTKVVFVGDKNQLPSVGAGNILADIIASGVIAYHNLTQIYRQSENSLIIYNAHKINSGEMIDLSNKSSDFFFESKEEPADIAKTVIDLVCERLPKFLKTDPLNIQVLAPLKVGKAGVDSLNEELQQRINPHKIGQRDIEFERITFRLGDKVIQTQNNYKAEWEKEENGQIISGLGIFNGDIGTIDEINAETGETTILFDDGRRAKLNRKDLYKIMLAYAITVHKSQGCEFDAVIIPVVAGAPIIFTRNLLYTAVTRAKKTVVLVGTKQYISRMIKNNYIEKRYSRLLYFLQKQETSFNELYGED